jgi:hypothetical protein
MSNADECIFTVYRKLNGPCVCDEACEYRIKCERCHNCALDFASEGKHTLEEVAEVMEYTPAYIMVLQAKALNKIKKRLPKDFKNNIYD